MNSTMSSFLYPAPESINMSRFKFVYWPPVCESIGISIIYQAKTNDDNNNKLSYHKWWWQTIWRKMGMIMAYSRNIAIIYNKIRCRSSIWNIKTGVTADADDGTGREILSLSMTYPADISHILHSSGFSRRTYNIVPKCKMKWFSILVFFLIVVLFEGKI